jgi:hypothetical protein
MILIFHYLSLYDSHSLKNDLDVWPMLFGEFLKTKQKMLFQKENMKLYQSMSSFHDV